MDVLERQPAVSGRLFYLADIQGVWSAQARAYVRQNIVSDFDHPVPEQLPPQGLLAVDPIVYWSNVLAEPTLGFVEWVQRRVVG